MVIEVTRQCLRGLLIAETVANDVVEVEDGIVVDPTNTSMVGVFIEPVAEVEDGATADPTKTSMVEAFAKPTTKVEDGAATNPSETESKECG